MIPSSQVYEDTVLDSIRLSIAGAIEASAIEKHSLREMKYRVSYDEYLNNYCRNLVISLETYVAGERLDKIVTIKHPKNWYQAVRATFCPKWWLKKYPVILHIEEISFNIVYPDFVFKINEDSARVIINRDCYTDSKE